MPGILLRHDASRLHDTGAHPERIARIVAVEQALAERDWLGYRVADSPDVPDGALHAVHPARYCSAIEAQCASGGGALDPDTITSEGSYLAARHACGGAVAMVDELAAGRAGIGASLHRPPGHHAEAGRSMGFCLLNHAAVAARHAVEAHGLERVLILDWDVHHGNGTNDIFHADASVFYASIHESPLYPGTGSAADAGSGSAQGLTLNMPVASGSGDSMFAALVDHALLPAALYWRPQLVLISAGFDAHADDPLAGCVVTEAGYARMAASMLWLSTELDVPLGLVLEGGYDLPALVSSLLATLETLAGVVEAPVWAEPSPAVADVAERALAGVKADRA